MTARWCKLHHEFADEVKWLRVAELAGVSGELVESCFVQALTYASRNDQRGSIGGIDLGAIAWRYRKPVEIIGQVFDALRAVGVIAGDRIANWAKRQTDDARQARPRSKGAARTARWRARQAAPKAPAAPAASPNVTPSPASQTASHVTPESDSEVPSSRPDGRDDGEREGVARARDFDRDTPSRDPPSDPPSSDTPSRDPAFRAGGDLEINRGFARLCAVWRNPRRLNQARAVYAGKRRAGVAADTIQAGAEAYAAMRAGEAEHCWRTLAEWLRWEEWTDRLQGSLTLPLPGGAAASAAAEAASPEAFSAAAVSPTLPRGQPHAQPPHDRNRFQPRDRDADRAEVQASLAAAAHRRMAAGIRGAGDHDGGDRPVAG